MGRSLVKATGAKLTATVAAELDTSTSADATSEEVFRKATQTIRGAIGTPEQIRDYIRGFEEAGVDQMIFVAQAGLNKHEDICASLELFAREVMPEFKQRDPDHHTNKARRLAPIIDKIMARRPPPEEPDPNYEIGASAVF